MTELQSDGTAVDDPEIAALAPWFHNLHLPGGRCTAPDHPLGDFPAFKWERLAAAVPDRLDGKTVLDIGCNAGFYSFEMAKRGAEVLAIDHDEHYLTQARWAAGRLGLADRIEVRRMGVYDLAYVEVRFDLVLFLGVLYHLRHPLLALDIVSERVRDRLVLQTLTVPGPPAERRPGADLPFGERARLAEPWWPTMAFVEHRLAGDPTNWWVPTQAAVEAMARSAGLRLVERADVETWIFESGGAFPHRAELDAATRRQGAGVPGGPSNRR